MQHYKHIAFFNRTKEQFLSQQERDKYKKQWCIDNKIYLISIPYTENGNLESYITKELKNGGFYSI